MIDSDNRPGAVPIQQSTTRIRRRRHRYIENESPATSPLVRFVIVITGIDVARRIVPGKDEREHMADDDCCSRGLRKQT